MPVPQLSLAALATPKGLLIAGVPIVGIVALLNHKGAKPAVVTGAVTNANDTAIGTGQLADFENALLAAISYQPPAADTGSPSAPTSQPPTSPTAPTQPVTATTPVAVPAPAALPVVGTLNAQPVVQTPQGFEGQYLGTAPGVNYSGLVDLVDTRSGLATISGLTAAEAANYSGYNVVPHNSAPVPVGGK